MFKVYKCKLGWFKAVAYCGSFDTFARAYEHIDSIINHSATGTKVSYIITNAISSQLL